MVRLLDLFLIVLYMKEQKLNYIAVDEPFRRQGIAQKLLNFVLADLKK